MRAFIFGLFLAATLMAGSAQAVNDKDFLTAREAYSKGQIDRFERLADKFPADHPLQPYLRYWRLKSRSASTAEMESFIARHGDSPLSERMRQELVRFYGKQEDWSRLRQAAAGLTRVDNELRCLLLRGRLAQGEAAAGTEGRALYLTGQDLPSSCQPLFDDLAQRGLLSQGETLGRLRLALDAGNLRLARELDAGLPAEERMDPDALAQAERAPESLLQGTSRRAQREVALYALTLMAKKDPQQAARWWESRQADFPEEDRGYGWGQVAMHAARAHQPDAVNLFLRAGMPRSDAQRAWRARAMLRAGNWLEVHRSIAAMPEAMQAEPVWRYWKGRALKALGSPYPANLLFSQLSREFHYYGLLAEEELPTRLENRPQDYRLSSEDLRGAENDPGLSRALLLRRLGLNADATAEWDWALRGRDDPAILAAAELARRAGWNDRAIATAEKTRELHNFDLRYITPYRDLAEGYSRQQGLDPAWVYGLMRQESRFVDYARSGAGARGLMQIMPTTAKWIGGQLGLGRKAVADVGDPETNIRFGTYYLKRILTDLGGSPVLATAGYNAGPGRARRWQAEVPLEGAIYVETIPFVETRDYVKKVLANAMFYSHRLAVEGGRLKDRLGVVPARTGS